MRSVETKRLALYLLCSVALALSMTAHLGGVVGMDQGSGESVDASEVIARRVVVSEELVLRKPGTPAEFSVRVDEVNGKSACFLTLSSGVEGQEAPSVGVIVSDDWATLVVSSAGGSVSLDASASDVCVEVIEAEQWSEAQGHQVLKEGGSRVKIGSQDNGPGMSVWDGAGRKRKELVWDDGEGF